MINIINGNITSAKGFMAAATAAHIKYDNRDDMALIYSKSPCVAAGTYTSNLVKAAPVIWDRKITESNVCPRAIVINSGIANACTKKEGLESVKKSALKVAQTLNINAEEVLVASTGVIGMPLPIDKITDGIEKLSKKLDDSYEAGVAASKAIMTTDTKNKQVALTFVIGGKTVTMGGICKGSGMIHPNMCTMLSFVTCDVAITKEMLTKAVKEDVIDTYNMISVDGDTSTNDTLLVLANGEAANPIIDKEGEDFEIFRQALHYVNETLAKKMAADGEGASALFEVEVINAKSKEDARILAKSVVTSSLTKAAIYGHDANWGRILCALGYSGACFDPDNIKLYFESDAGKILIYEDGGATDYSEEEATKILSQSAVKVTADMNQGEYSATAWGCDLTYDYVKINADYRS